MSAKYFEELGDIYDANILEESETVGNLDQLESDTKALDHSGPEAAEGFEKPDETEGGHADNYTQPVKKDKKEVKKESREINNSNMKDTNQQTTKSTFDRLFEDVMGGDLDMDLGDDLGGEDIGDDIGGDDDLGGGTVTLELDRDVAEKLHGMLGDILGGDDLGDVDDIEDIDDEGDDMENIEAVDMEAAPDSVGHLTGKNNKAALSTDGGHADGSAGGEEDGGKPKPANDSVAHLTGKNNKAGNVKGGNAFSH